MKKQNKHRADKDNHAIEEYAEAAVGMLRDSYHSELEPFEAYAARLKGEMVKNLVTFRERLVHGYDVLLRELARQDRPPSGSSGGIRP